MTNLLRVLDLLEKADVKALQCEVPVELLNGLNLQEDGTVDLETLLKICHRANRVDSLKDAQKRRSLNNSNNSNKNNVSSICNMNPELMDLIFNPGIASDFSNKIKN